VRWVNGAENGDCIADDETFNSDDEDYSCNDIPLLNGQNSIVVTAVDNEDDEGQDSTIVTYYEPIGTYTILGPTIIYIYTGATSYIVIGSVWASGPGSNSFFIDIDSNPSGDQEKAWHLDEPGSGYEVQTARWGVYDDPGAYQDPVVWELSEGNHLLYLIEREVGTLIESLTVQLSTSPTSFEGTALSSLRN